MALKVKSLDASTSKWSENAGRAATSYATEAMASAEDWAKGAAGAAANFKQAVQASNIGTLFASGVRRAGAAKYARKIEAVGKDRFAPGVAAATVDYKDGAAPYYSLLASITLDPRKPKGDPANIKRVEQVTKALAAKRLALLGAGVS